MRAYTSLRLKRARAEIDGEPLIDAADYLARTVYENQELVDTGVLDQQGNPVMAYEKPNPIGYVRLK